MLTYWWNILQLKVYSLHLYSVFKCIIYERLMETICVCAFYLQVCMMTILWHGGQQNLGGRPSRGGMWEGWIVLYLYLFSRMLGCHGNPEKPVGAGSFLRFGWARLPRSALVHATPQFPPPPTPVTPTLAQVNSFNNEYKSDTSHIYTGYAAVRHATSFRSPYIECIS